MLDCFALSIVQRHVWHGELKATYYMSIIKSFNPSVEFPEIHEA